METSSNGKEGVIASSHLITTQQPLWSCEREIRNRRSSILTPKLRRWRDRAMINDLFVPTLRHDNYLSPRSKAPVGGMMYAGLVPVVLPTPEDLRSGVLDWYPDIHTQQFPWLPTVLPTPVCCLHGDCDPENERLVKADIAYGMSAAYWSYLEYGYCEATSSKYDI